MTTAPQFRVPHFRVQDERDGLIDHVTPESLRPFLLERADGHAGAVRLSAVDVVLDGQRLTGDALATPEGTGGWAVRINADGPELTGRAPNTDAVFDLLRSWAAGDGWWAEAFSWQSA